MPIYNEDTAGTVKRQERWFDEVDGTLKERGEVWLENPAGTLKRYHNIPRLYGIDASEKLRLYDKFGERLTDDLIALAGDASFNAAAVAVTSTRRYIADVSGAVRVYNTSRQRVSAEEFAIGTGAISMDVNGSKLYVLRSNKRIHVYNLTTRTQITAETVNLSGNSADLVSIEVTSNRIKVLGHLVVGGRREAIQESVTETVDIDSNWAHWDYADRWLRETFGIGTGRRGREYFTSGWPAEINREVFSSTRLGADSTAQAFADLVLNRSYYNRGFRGSIQLVYALQSVTELEPDHRPPGSTINIYDYRWKLKWRRTRTVTRFQTVGGRTRSTIYSYNHSGVTQSGEQVFRENTRLLWAATSGSNIFTYQSGDGLVRYNSTLTTRAFLARTGFYGSDFSLQGSQIFAVGGPNEMRVYSTSNAARATASEIDLRGSNPPEPRALCKQGNRYYAINDVAGARSTVLAYDLNLNRTPNDDWTLHSHNLRPLDIATDGTYFYVADLSVGRNPNAITASVFVYRVTTKARQLSRELVLPGSTWFGNPASYVAVSDDAIFVARTRGRSTLPDLKDTIYKFSKSTRAQLATRDSFGLIVRGLEWFDGQLVELSGSQTRWFLSAQDGNFNNRASYRIDIGAFPRGIVFL